MRIIAAALEHKKTGTIYQGTCHTFAFLDAPIGSEWNEFEIGFLTSTCKFVTSEQAYRISKASHQLIGEPSCSSNLISENIDM